MLKFLKPRNIEDCFLLTTFVLKMSGLFPYKFDDNGRFYISWRLYILTVLHLGFYLYVNITLVWEDWEDYSQPLIGASWITARINLVLRLIGILITLTVLVPVLLRISRIVTILNDIIELLTFYKQLGINLLPIYRKIQLYAYFSSFSILCVWIFGSWHSLFFYQLITKRTPLFKYKLTIILSNYYKAMTLLQLWTTLFSIYAFSHYLNQFLETLVRRQREQSLQRAALLRA